MTELSKKAVEDFQALIEKKRGIKPSYEEAESMALNWLQFFKLVYKPIPKDKS